MINWIWLNKLFILWNFNNFIIFKWKFT